MTCWPPCSPWCVCVDGECQPAPLLINAIRIKTLDGRYLQRFNGVGTYLSPTSNAPGPSETFLLEPAPGPAAHTSGSQIGLRAVDGSWRGLPDVLVRVDHDVRVLPHHRKGDRLVTYQIGGPGESVLVQGPFSAGYPAYPGDDPAERTFTITKLEGGAAAPDGTPIQTGDRVTFTSQTTNPAVPGRSWRLIDTASPPHVDGDAEPGGPAATEFTVEINEARADLGWRPRADMPCRSCAAVTALVTSARTG